MPDIRVFQYQSIRCQKLCGFGSVLRSARISFAVSLERSCKWWSGYFIKIFCLTPVSSILENSSCNTLYRSLLLRVFSSSVVREKYFGRCELRSEAKYFGSGSIGVNLDNSSIEGITFLMLCFSKPKDLMSRPKSLAVPFLSSFLSESFIYGRFGSCFELFNFTTKNNCPPFMSPMRSAARILVPFGAAIKAWFSKKFQAFLFPKSLPRMAGQEFFFW